jgi:hypothetical protein
MAYRASETTNTGISPHEVMFRRPMRLATDWSLSAPGPVTPSAVQYAREIGPKLDVLHQIAMTNADDSAARHRRAHNEGAMPPPYAAGDKVLLRDTRVKKGETAKLNDHTQARSSLRSADPDSTTAAELKTGRDLKRAVHADRLRPVREMQNDYRQTAINRVVAAGELRSKRVIWRIVINNGEQNDLGVSVRLTAPELAGKETRR